MKIKLEETISIMQAGFREERGTRDQIVNIRNIIDKCKEHRMALYLCFIDYSSLLKSIWMWATMKMWMILTMIGFLKHVPDLDSKINEDQKSAVRTRVGNTGWFSIGRGLQQGCILSPMCTQKISWERHLMDLKEECVLRWENHRFEVRKRYHTLAAVDMGRLTIYVV